MVFTEEVEEMGHGKGEPTPNRVQSSSLELPRCEGGKDHEVGLKEKGEMAGAMLSRMELSPFSFLISHFNKTLILRCPLLLLFRQWH